MPEAADGANCDPNCKWRNSVAVLKKQRDFELEAVPHVQDVQTGSVARPTSEGYEMQEETISRFHGIGILGNLGADCAQVCRIENYVNSEPDRLYGAEVQLMISNLKGE